MGTPKMTTDRIIALIGQHFRTFGGGRDGYDNPCAAAMKDKPLMFAAGVSVKDVVRFVETCIIVGEVTGSPPHE